MCYPPKTNPYLPILAKFRLFHMSPLTNSSPPHGVNRLFFINCICKKSYRVAMSNVRGDFNAVGTNSWRVFEKSLAQLWGRNLHAFHVFFGMLGLFMLKTGLTLKQIVHTFYSIFYFQLRLDILIFFIFWAPEYSQDILILKFENITVILKKLMQL